MIKVQPNTNVIYLLFLFNIISKYPKELHPLGKKLLNRFKIEGENFEKLEQLYLNKEIPNHPYQFILFAINSNNDLTPKSQSPDDGYGPRMYGIYSEKMYSLVFEIEKELNFFSVFEKEFMPEYESICKSIQKYFDGSVEKILKEVWQLEKNYNFFLIPNFLLMGEGAGMMRGKNMYSISSPVPTKENTINFYSQHLISNCIHELSHCILQRQLIKENRYLEVRELTKSVEIPETLKNIHYRGDNYIEETFIKVFTLFALNHLYKNSMKQKELEGKAKEKISYLVSNNYKYAPVFYKNLQKNNNPFKAYFKTIEDILNI